MSTSQKLWLVGSGPMAQAYASVLQAQSVDFQVIGRGVTSASIFQQVTGVPVVCGGLEAALSKLPPPKLAIVAVGVEQLASVAMSLIRAGCKRLLLEKPGALYLAELEDLYSLAHTCSSEVWVAYNRRFYASVQLLRNLVSSDGGVLSALFEFTEWSHKIRPLHKAAGVKERWLLSNSSHVLDLTFSLIGFPADHQWHAWQVGSLDWHPAASRFTGAGLTELGVPFSYHADWDAPGRWGIEILTQKSRYLLRPMESLQVVHTGSVDSHFLPLNDELDRQFKPGLYLQCQHFLNNLPSQLCSLSDQIKAFRIYSRIGGYTL